MTTTNKQSGKNRYMETVLKQAKHGDKVTVHFTGRLINGKIFDSSAGRAPLSVDLGSGQVIVGFEEAIIGMSEGESKTVTIPYDKAYGPHYEGQVVNFPSNRVPLNIEPEVGTQIKLQSKDGQPYVVRVTEVSKEHVTIDANLPLAGQDLVFDIKLISVKA